MKIAVFSDSHGYGRKMLDAVLAEAPGAIVFCGDGLRDLRELNEAFPNIPIYAVAGNCDYAPAVPISRAEEFNGAKILITHGHRYGVKSGDLSRLAYAAQEAGAKIALYGHTHNARADKLGGVALINPGSIGMGYKSSYCLLEIDSAGDARWKFVDI